MKVGDIIKLPNGPMAHYDLSSNVGILWKKLPRKDYLEYDWEVYVDSNFIKLGRQIEYNGEKLNESR